MGPKTKARKRAERLAKAIGQAWGPQSTPGPEVAAGLMTPPAPAMEVGQRGGVGSAISKLLSSAGAKKGLGGLVGWMALEQMLSAGNLAAEQGIARKAIEAQASSATPEALYYSAALPQAREEEEQARQALLNQISGGVLGPTLAKGERLIGG